MAKKPEQPFDRRTFLKTTGAVGTATALANVASAHGDHDETDIRHGDEQQRRDLGENQLVVGVSAGTPVAAVERDLPAAANVVRRNEDLRYVVVEMPEGQGEFGTLQVESRIASHSGVRYTERNETYYPLAASPDGATEAALPSEEADDSLFDQQYAPQQVRAPEAWNATMGSDDVTIAIIDQGVDYEHPDLKDRFGSTKGKDFVDDDDDPMPESPSYEYHGTHVAGIASATTGNGTGVAGISNSRLLSCRALGTFGGTMDDIADAIKWAADQGADVINMSLGGGGFSRTMKNAVSYATNNGTLCVCAAGNSCKEGVSYPAAYNECMAISAINENLELASFSQYGDNVDVTAPGVDVLSCWTTEDTDYEGKYEAISGTSMSTPVVVGVAALAKAAEPAFTPTEVRNWLKETAVDIGLSDKEQGAGRVDAVRAVGWLGEDGENSGPAVDMDVEPIAPHVGENVILSGQAAEDDDGYISEWRWDLGDGTTATGEQAYHQFSEPGTKEISLTVEDDDGATDSISTTIEVRRGACGDETHTEQFDGQLDRGRDINRHPYVFETEEPCRIRGVIDNSSVLLFAQQQSTEFLKTECEGELVLTSDDLRDLNTDQEISIGAYTGMFSGSAEYLIEVTEEGFGQPENERPEARFTASSTTVEPDEMVEFDATPSKDPDGRIDQYVWTFGDVAASSGKRANHSFSNTGEFGVTLEVTDNRGAVDSASKIITVEESDSGTACASEASVTMQETGSLTSQQIDRTFTHPLESANSCEATVSLSGPESADFDLYVTLDGREPSTTDYDRKSFNYGSDEEIVVDGEDLESELGILVHAYSGSGEFDLEVSEVLAGEGSDDGGSDDGGSDDGGSDDGGSDDGGSDDGGSDDGGSDDDDGDDGSTGECGVVRETDSMNRGVGRGGGQFLRYAPQTDDPCQVTFTLSGPGNSDFDMYVNLDGSRPQSYDADLKSETPDSNEQILVDDVDGELGVLVQSWDGAGPFTVEVEELGK